MSHGLPAEQRGLMAQHPEVATDQERRAAWAAAKLAARLYARDPSRQNEGRVRSAWQRLRDITDRSVDLRSARTLSNLHRNGQA